MCGVAHWGRRMRVTRSELSRSDASVGSQPIDETLQEHCRATVDCNLTHIQTACICQERLSLDGCDIVCCALQVHRLQSHSFP